MNQKHFFFTALFALSLIVSGCGPSATPPGTIRGKLINTFSNKPTNCLLFLAAENTEGSTNEGAILELVGDDGKETKYLIVNEQAIVPEPDGSFVVSNLIPGKYLLFCILDADSYGIKSSFLEDKSGQRLIVDLTEGKGIDLGEVFVQGE